MVVVWLGLPGRQRPGVEGEVEFSERCVFEQAVRPPTSINLCEMGQERDDLSIDVWGRVVVEEGLDMVRIEQH